MTTAVIVAAGRGTRMGPGIDKLFLEIAGRTIVGHTWKRFDGHPEVDHVVLVVRSGCEDAFRDIGATLELTKSWSLVAGGRERQDSVWNGIQAAPPGTRWIAVQDGARPCTTPDTISRCLADARRSGASVAAQRVVDTIKESTPEGGWVGRHLDRSRLWSVQTPQCFAVEILTRSLEKVRQEGVLVTDDTAACGFAGHPVVLTDCPDPNPKVTSPADLPLVAHWLTPPPEPLP